MGRLTGSDISDYGAGSSYDSEKKKLNYFSLKDDKQTAKIRLLYDGTNDMEGFSVHRVPIDDSGKERYVMCLRNNKNDPLDNCPLCREGTVPGNEKIDKFKSRARMWIPIYNEDVNEFQIWERPGTFYDKLCNYTSRYQPTVAQVFEVVRNGKRGDTKTTYDLFPVGNMDGTTIDDILDDCDMDDLPKIVGRFVLDKSADDMEYYIKNGEFPDANSDSVPVRRRNSDSNEEAPRSERRRGRDRF